MLALVATAPADAPAAPGASGDSAPVPFDAELVLRVRHPEIAGRDDFVGWAKQYTVGIWHETAAGDGLQTVVVQNGRGDRVFAVLINVAEKHVQRSAMFDLGALAQTRTQITLLAEGQKIERRRIRALRPTVQWLPADKTELNWELEVERGTPDVPEFFGPAIDLFQIKDKRWEKIRTLSPLRSDMPPPMAPPPAPQASALSDNDYLAGNELHHLADFQAEALGWIDTAATVEEKARCIFERVEKTYLYDLSVPNIREFTWADYLTREQNGRRGICDEFSVVTVSYLRAVGIPACVKFLVWDYAGKRAAHAVVEYRDGATWKHMDPVWRAFNDPGVYRRRGVTNVMVMDADFPLDSRSVTNPWQADDQTGDDKLFPYGDYVVMPQYPGKARPGY